HVGEVAVVGGTVAVAHAVEATEVARALGGRNHVIGGNRQLGVGQRDLDRGGAERAVLVDRGLDRGAHVVGHALGEELARQSDAQAREGAGGGRRGERGGVVFGRALQAGGVALVEAGHRRQQQRAVFGAGTEGAALVERGGVGDHAVAADHPVGGL